MSHTTCGPTKMAWPTWHEATAHPLCRKSFEPLTANRFVGLHSPILYTPFPRPFFCSYAPFFQRMEQRDDDNSALGESAMVSVRQIAVGECHGRRDTSLLTGAVDPQQLHWKGRARRKKSKRSKDQKRATGHVSKVRLKRTGVP